MRDVMLPWTEQFTGIPLRMRFMPKRIDDLRPAAVQWIGKIVTVESWHQDVCNPEKSVGHVAEFGMDVPEDELQEADE